MPVTALRLGAFILLFTLVVFPRAAFAQSAKAWSGGKLFVPASLTNSGAACDSAPGGKCESEIKPGKHPVIVFLHGCGGVRAPKPFLDRGAIVVAPNSFANGDACKPDAQYMNGLVKKRHGDVSYAAKQLKDTAWADSERLVLAGFSNGAQSAATYPGGEFKARVIVAWTCNNPRVPEQEGVRGTGPVLALLGTADEFFKKIGITGNCNAAVKNRGEGSQSILIPGGGHEILDHATTREAVAKFIPPVIK